MLFECVMYYGDFANIIYIDFGTDNTLDDVMYIIDEWEMKIVESSKNFFKAIFSGTDLTSRMLVCN